MPATDAANVEGAPLRTATPPLAFLYAAATLLCCLAGVWAGLTGTRQVVLGLVGGAAPAHWVATLIGTGFCGALPTYSTFGFETARLLEERKPQVAATYVVLSLLVGLAAVSLGWWLAGSA